MKKVLVSIIQHSPVFLDKKKSVDKAVELLKEAASHGSGLAVFGETWLSGYPAWLDYCPEAGLWGHEPVKALYLKTYENGVAVDGAEIETLKKAAKELKLSISIGINEIVDRGTGNKSIFNSLLFISDDGEIENHHRKLMPTYTEKMIYSHGDGNGLSSVSTDFGKVSGLICWEHWMPLTRQAMHHSGEDIHVAVWPKVHEMHQVASRQYAFEGRCFVLAAGQILRKRDLPDILPTTGLPDDPDYMVLNGGSAIIKPDGFYLTEPVFDQETIITAELDLSENIRESMTLDVTGHYQRNDVFQFDVNRERKP
ncbi:MAG: carbon-nitrogen hydrolase family protein [Cyclobacteriaceae bacterium]